MLKDSEKQTDVATRCAAATATSVRSCRTWVPNHVEQTAKRYRAPQAEPHHLLWRWSKRGWHELQACHIGQALPCKNRKPALRSAPNALCSAWTPRVRTPDSVKHSSEF